MLVHFLPWRLLPSGMLHRVMWYLQTFRRNVSPPSSGRKMEFLESSVSIHQIHGVFSQRTVIVNCCFSCSLLLIAFKCNARLSYYGYSKISLNYKRQLILRFLLCRFIVETCFIYVFVFVSGKFWMTYQIRCVFLEGRVRITTVVTALHGTDVSPLLLVCTAMWLSQLHHSLLFITVMNKTVNYDLLH
jgi:hypothetical protein